MKNLGHPYEGFLYAGLMINKDEPYLIEYNIRMGDPECQVLMMKLKTDFLEVVDFILSKNILWGDALTLKIPNQNNPIVFSEWSFIKGSLVKRREFLLSTIFENKEINATPLFQTAPEDIYIPSPSRVFKTVHFYDLVHEK